jgi:hypothetical protein
MMSVCWCRLRGISGQRPADLGKSLTPVPAPMAGIVLDGQAVDPVSRRCRSWVVLLLHAFCYIVFFVPRRVSDARHAGTITVQVRPLKVVTIRRGFKEDPDAALDRHFARRPEDRGANVVIFEFFDAADES